MSTIKVQNALHKIADGWAAPFLLGGVAMAGLGGLWWLQKRRREKRLEGIRAAIAEQEKLLKPYVGTDANSVENKFIAEHNMSVRKRMEALQQKLDDYVTPPAPTTVEHSDKDIFLKALIPQRLSVNQPFGTL